MLLGAPGLRASDILSNFGPASVRSDYGATSQIAFSTPPVELEPGSLAHHLPQAMKTFRFAEPVWVIGYKTDILDSAGKRPRENYLCHTFLADERVAQHEENEFKGIYSDAFTPEVQLPAGFGIPFSSGDSLHWMPMFNNRAEAPVRVAMQVTLTVIRAKDLRRPLKALYASLRSVQTPHLFFVPPGHDRREITFTVSFNGTIHFLGTHLHPHGVSVGLYNLSKREEVWTGKRQGGPVSPMDVYASAAGYPLNAGETYRITTVYDNPTGAKIDAMAGLFMLYSRE
jgi:hypothetical protein